MSSNSQPRSNPKEVNSYITTLQATLHARTCKGAQEKDVRGIVNELKIFKAIQSAEQKRSLDN